MVCDHDIDRKWSSNRPFEVSNINFLGGYTWGQQVLTKVDGNWKIHVFGEKQFLSKYGKISAMFEIRYFRKKISWKDIRHGILKPRLTSWWWKNVSQHLVNRCWPNYAFMGRYLQFRSQKHVKILSNTVFWNWKI